jgi:hypothetical protein
VEHPVGDTVTKRVGCHIVRVSSIPVDLPRLNAGDLGDFMKQIPNALLGDPSRRRMAVSVRVVYSRGSSVL